VLARTIVVIGGTCSLVRLHQLYLWCGHHWCTYWRERGHGVSARSLIVKIVVSSPGVAISETHLHVGKTHGLSTELPDRELGPCEGLQPGLGAYTKVVDGSLHLYLN
jgi:hypothetical protein